jgi:bifunctional UDP-N-acetylglucosamine pyrophosphorylase/glucosamine-1-phosphate N-acetyltransferase
LTAQAADPTGYGRIVRDHVGIVEKIVEQKDASTEEALIQEINTGTYCFDNELLFDALAKLDTDNAQGEYYLTDIIEILKEDGKIIAAYQTEDFHESLGVNDRIALAEANRLMRQRINRQHMQNGVTLIDPATTYIDEGVVIGSDTLIEAGVIIKGQTTIGEDCVITAASEIEDSKIGNQVTIKASTIEESIIHDGADVGPNAHLRPNAEILAHAHIGNFVEIKNATIGEGTKVGHLSYVGDATLGKNINVGCGVVFVNYDGKSKFKTTVGDNCFIGSGSNLVAPLTIEEETMIAAGSTITKDVPKHSMAIARARQENKADYAKKLPYLN